MFTAQRSLTESSHGSSRSSRPRCSRFFEIPNSAVRFVVIALAVGFPIAMLLSWLYELTPEGIVLTEDLDPVQARSVQRATGRILDFIIIGVLLLVIAMLIVGRRPFYRQTGESISQKSIAVLPFQNLSADPENAFFTDGVQDEILNALAKIADLKVRFWRWIAAASPNVILAETSSFALPTRRRCSRRNSASFACATLKCDVLSDFQTSLPSAKALA
jgi:hypothetical protein